jgi:glycosyltransferase involved in cell wall biosynthesis
MLSCDDAPREDGRLTENFDIATLSAYRCCYFVLRADHADKSGGDVDLARQIARMAEAAGAVVHLISIEDMPSSSGANDLFFLFNIDRPYEAASALDHAHPDARILLYTLHHPVAGIHKYLARVGGAKRVLAGMASGQPDRYEALVDVAKAVRMRDHCRLRAAFGRERLVARLLRRCELLVTSDAELAEIEQRYGTVPRKAWLLPHPVAPYAPPAASDALRYVLVPGRIEPRKNQRAALKTLVAMDLRERGFEIVLAGGKGSDGSYFGKTLDYAMANNVIYLSHLPKSLFFPAVSGAALVINASFFEVTSLIDLYAIAHRIPLVTTIHGYYAAAPNLRQVDPASWGQPDAALRTAIDAMLG